MASLFLSLSKDHNSLSCTSPSTAGTDIDGPSSINQYTLREEIGQGAYGKVKLAIDKNTREQFAVKIVSKDDLKKKRQLVRDENGKIKYKDALDNLQQEIAIMKQLDHPNIVKFHESMEPKGSPYVYMVMEYLKGGQLLEWDDTKKEFYNMTTMRYLSEDALRPILRGILAGVEYLHQNGIVHRDIKPQNILQDESGNPKIVDFGTAVKLTDPDNDIMNNNEGTHAFMAPESFADNIAEKGYSGKAADLWCMGITFFAFVFNSLPFYSDDPLELFEEIESKPLRFPSGRKISVELRNILERLLEKDPKRRIQIEELRKNPWFSQKKNALFKVEDITNRLESQYSVGKLRKASTMQEEDFTWIELCVKDVKHERRIGSSKFDKYGQPQKKVHRSSS